ncbi:beta-ketoacyl-[acyl-carrier-protein] synthase family protein [Streptomyces microflavus]|uniref:beta-ketoacyl-[acyl-carrier-protein] synthase family protein n=1 Tax=Streptomyces microflavus TaxID=1919 RepID=UPI0037FDBD19
MTGIGMVTPGGPTTAETWQAILDGRATAVADGSMTGLPVELTSRAATFDADAVLGRRTAWRLDRCTQLALVAGREAVADAGLTPLDWNGPRVGVVIGTALGGIGTWEKEHRKMLEQGSDRISPLTVPMSLTNMVAAQLATDSKASGPSLAVSTACASGATAIGVARELLRSGVCDVVLAGGSEACVIPSVVAAFSKAGALSKRVADPTGASRPFDVDRDGFVIAEGSAVFVMERAEHAMARGARVHAYVSGYGASSDAGHETRPDPEGRAAERAMLIAMDDAAVSVADIVHVNAHGTSTPLNDVTEARTIRRTLGAHPAVTSVKGVTGHTLGAAGAIEAAVTALSLSHQVVPATAGLIHQDPEIELDIVVDKPRPLRMEAALSNSFGFGGQNAVLVLTRS